VRGRLINPFFIELAQLDTDATAADPDGDAGPRTSGYDEDFREPVAIVDSTDTSEDATSGFVHRVERQLFVPAQIEDRQFNDLQQFFSGANRNAALECVLHFKDLEKLKLDFPRCPYPNIMRSIEASVEALDVGTSGTLRIHISNTGTAPIYSLVATLALPGTVSLQPSVDIASDQSRQTFQSLKAGQDAVFVANITASSTATPGIYQLQLSLHVFLLHFRRRGLAPPELGHALETGQPKQQPPRQCCPV